MFAFTVMAQKLLHKFYLNLKYISLNSNLFRIMILMVYASTIVFITQRNYTVTVWDNTATRVFPQATTMDKLRLH